MAVEKKLAALLSIDLPGSKVVIGEGPQPGDLQRRLSVMHFLGAPHGRELASHLAAADVFAFPSRTDTCGVVQLEAISCGGPVAAFPVTGPRDTMGHGKGRVLDNDLGIACRAALGLSGQALIPEGKRARMNVSD